MNPKLAYENPGLRIDQRCVYLTQDLVARIVRFRGYQGVSMIWGYPGQETQRAKRNVAVEPLVTPEGVLLTESDLQAVDGDADFDAIVVWLRGLARNARTLRHLREIGASLSILDEGEAELAVVQSLSDGGEGTWELRVIHEAPIQVRAFAVADALTKLADFAKNRPASSGNN